MYVTSQFDYHHYFHSRIPNSHLKHFSDNKESTLEPLNKHSPNFLCTY